MSSIQSLDGLLQDRFMYPKGPGLGAAQMLWNTKSVFHIGTLSSIDFWEPNAYSQVIPLVSDRCSEVRDSILRECVLHLPIPLKIQSEPTVGLMGSAGNQQRIDKQMIEKSVGDTEISSRLPKKRRFKPLFYMHSRFTLLTVNKRL
ncbi:unnamed protein product [Heterobilharzia americana]|nr:unnamed protein product [Heterobilharzia americana]